ARYVWAPRSRAVATLSPDTPLSSDRPTARRGPQTKRPAVKSTTLAARAATAAPPEPRRPVLGVARARRSPAPPRRSRRPPPPRAPTSGGDCGRRCANAVAEAHARTLPAPFAARAPSAGVPDRG